MSIYPPRPLYKVGDILVAEEHEEYEVIMFEVDYAYRDRKKMVWVYQDFDKKFEVYETSVIYKVKKKWRDK